MTKSDTAIPRVLQTQSLDNYYMGVLLFLPLIAFGQTMDRPFKGAAHIFLC
jgi:hypothetical protein